MGPRLSSMMLQDTSISLTATRSSIIGGGFDLEKSSLRSSPIKQTGYTSGGSPAEFVTLEQNNGRHPKVIELS